MSRESKIGVFVLLGLCVMAYFVYRTSDVKKWLSGESSNMREVGVELVDASGMRQGTPVEIAGVKIGEVERIELEGDRAIVVVIIPGDMVFKQGAMAEVRSKGMLGERYIALNLGTGDVLLEQARILGSAPPDLGAITSTVNDLAKNLVEITESLKASTFSDDGGNRISQIASNMEEMTAVLVAMLEENRTNMAVSSANISSLTSNLNREVPLFVKELTEFSKALRLMAEGNRGNVDETMTRMTSLAKNFDEASSSLTSIAAKVDNGTGSLGQLVNNPNTVEKMNDVLDNVNASLTEVKNLIGKATGLEVDLIARSEWFSEFSTTKSYFGMRIQPNEDKFYLLEGVSLGDDLTLPKESRVTELTYDGNGDLVSTAVSTSVEDPSDFLFNGQLAYRLGPVFVRGGIIESEGGGGIDYFTADKKIKLSFEAFDFSRTELGPHGRLDFRYRLGDNLHLNLGWDDMLESSRDSAVLGAGIRWRDEDLKILFTQVGRFL